MNMDRYVCIRSEESNYYFSDNYVYKFKVHSATPLYLPDVWNAGLVEFKARRGKTRISKKDDGAIYVFANICKDSILDGVEKPLFQRLQLIV